MSDCRTNLNMLQSPAAEVRRTGMTIKEVTLATAVVLTLTGAGMAAADRLFDLELGGQRDRADA